MSETFLGGRVTLWRGDVRAMLAQMPPDSVDCVVTSPPYWGLRDYGVEGQIGLEATLGEHLAVMVEVFALVRRVLKPSGTLWINYGDCYATAPNGRSAADTKAAGTDDRTFRDKPFSTVGPVAGGYLKPKDLCMVPNRLAIALQDDGWWVRSEIVWGKTNPMPDSSGAYRPSTAHEKIFLLTKSDDGEVYRARDTGEISFFPDLSERCPLVTDPSREAARWSRIGSYYDAEAVRQGFQPTSVDRLSQDIEGQTGSARANGGSRADRPMKAVRGRSTCGRHTLGDALPEQARRGLTPRHEGGINHTGLADLGRGEGRFLRNYEPAPPVVWPMATKAFSDAHFATFPPELAARCIAAGCPPAGLVLDPFGGSGTTALVAARMGRRTALIELNPDYAAMARRRIELEWMGVVDRAIAAAPPPAAQVGGLFAAIEGREAAE
ncbi:DNA-methyltransferase [Xanthobacter flavus]|uniref:DNA-methyltransferase n=1 Tax=Xanthobacter flavus TaxID=281 RepID=UPI0037282E9A